MSTSIPDEIVLVTGNINKYREFMQILNASNINLNIIHKNIDLPEIQSVSSQEVVLAKVNEAYRITNTPVICEDTALYIDDPIAVGVKRANGFPGALIKWYLEYYGCAGISDRHAGQIAYAYTYYAYHDGTTAHLFEGFVRGKITYRTVDIPWKFGWDGVFEPDGYDITFAEMTPSVKNSISQRNNALKKFIQFMKT